MNKFSGVGRITRDITVTYAGELAIAKSSIAINRKFKRDGEPDADFINFVAFGKVAELIEKYTSKGSKIGIVGRIQTGNYTNKDGVKVYTTDIVVEEIDFLDSKASAENNEQKKETRHDPNGDGFMNIPDGIDEELPFN